jgi:hypothetical protein
LKFFDERCVPVRDTPFTKLVEDIKSLIKEFFEKHRSEITLEELAWMILNLDVHKLACAGEMGRIRYHDKLKEGLIAEFLEDEVLLEVRNAPEDQACEGGYDEGRLFRNRQLLPILRNPKIKKLTIDLDGTFGYPCAWLTGAFLGLAHELEDGLMIEIDFVSHEEPSMADKVFELMGKKV